MTTRSDPPRRSGTTSLPWARPWEEVARDLGVDPERGLSPDEVQARRKRYGANRLRARPRRSVWRILGAQFRSPIVLLLAAAAAASLAFGKWPEGIAIGVALVINAGIGFATELKATRSMEALRRLGTTTAKVVRDGGAREVPARELVPGDAVLLEAGDLVPADLRLVEANNLQADESALTGESVTRTKGVDPVARDAPLAERTNLLFRGTAVTAGSGRAVTVATGMATELGNVASLAEEAESEGSPLEERLGRLGQRLLWATAAVGILVAAAGLLGGKPALRVLETAIAMAVAAVPEGLPVVATIALARGVWRMARREALVSRLSAVETLGATGVICTDKTGTLTENRMAARTWLLASGETGFDDGDGAPDPSPLLRRAIEIGVLCNNARVDPGQGGVGDPTEVALLRAGADAGICPDALLDTLPEIREVAFDVSTQMMATYHRDGDGVRVAVKGAPEAVLAAARRVTGPEGESPLEAEDRDRWLDRNVDLARRGLRVLALAEKRVAADEAPPYEDLTLVGLVGLLDPPREQVRDALGRCRAAGIRVVMVTGDQADTARGVARAVGLVGDGEVTVMEGGELAAPEDLDEAERHRVLEVSVFARVTPEQKLDLVGLHQAAGAVVAMTGDGVNDAPALEKADIGVAMGRRGTQVAREAADIVLRDDRFETIVVAVTYGRVIFDNIRKFIVYLLSGNGSEVLAVTVVGLTGAPLPLGPLQILYINLVADVLPALALGAGRGDPAVMTRPPRDPAEPVLTRDHWLAVALYSAVLAAAVVGAFTVALGPLDLGPDRAVSTSFLTLAFARLWHVFNLRDRGSSPWRNEVTTNPYVWGALAAGVALTLAAALVPGLAAILGVVPPGSAGWGVILGASLLPVAVVQAALVATRGRGRRLILPRGR